MGRTGALTVDSHGKDDFLLWLQGKVKASGSGGEQGRCAGEVQKGAADLAVQAAVAEDDAVAADLRFQVLAARLALHPTDLEDVGEVGREVQRQRYRDQILPV